MLSHIRPLPFERVNTPLMLAPMVGLTHVATRNLIRRFLPEDMTVVFPTEMLNSRRLPEQEVGSTNETLKDDEETTLVPQLLANDEKFIIPSLEKLQDWGAMGIDINMGCPVRKALKHNYGVSLMGDPSYAKEVVRITVKNCSIPVSVKLRAGIEKDEDKLFHFVEGLGQAGASWVCLHPRLAGEKRRGVADWSQIKKLRVRTSIPIVGNGDIQVSDDIKKMFFETECDGVMVGRAMMARPWMFWQVGEQLGFESPTQYQGKKAPKNGFEEAKFYGESVIFFIEECFRYFEEACALKRIRFYLKVSHPWLNFGHTLMSAATKYHTKEELLDFCHSFFQKDSLFLSERTNLRY